MGFSVWGLGFGVWNFSYLLFLSGFRVLVKFFLRGYMQCYKGFIRNISRFRGV